MLTQTVTKTRRLACVLVLAVVATSPAVAASYTWHTWDLTAGGNGHLYSAIETPRTWSEQNTIAQGEGAYLVSIHSDAENDFLTSTFGGTTLYWIGLYQPPGTGEPNEGWRWTSGEPLTYTNWEYDEPNQSLGREEDYAITNWKQAGIWNDGEGTFRCGAIMEVTPELEPWMLLACTGALGVAIRRWRRK
jgi:hypothetical protein